MTREFRPILVAAKLPAVRFHDLQHTALLLAQGGRPPNMVETLGHSQIRLTMSAYSHVLPALQVEAAAKMDSTLRAIKLIKPFQKDEAEDFDRMEVYR